MLLIPTDLAINHFVKSLGDVDDKLRIAMPFDDDLFRTQVGAQFKPANLVTLGYPVWPEFTTDSPEGQAVSCVLENLGIAANDKVVLMMMGAEGASSATMIEDTRTLAEGLRGRDDTVHIVCFCGNNRVLKRAIDAVARDCQTSALRVHGLGFTQAQGVSTLMRRAAVIITKTGGGTVNEALASHLPMLFRAGSEQLWWEKGNSDFVTRHGLGAWTSGGAQLVGRVSCALQKKGATLAACPARTFGSNLQRCVGEFFA